MVDRAGVVADVGVFRKVPPAMNSGDRIRKPLPTNREAGTRTGHQQRSLMRLARVGTRVEVPDLLFCGLAERLARVRLTGCRLWHDREPGANKFFQPDETFCSAGLAFSDPGDERFDGSGKLRLSCRRNFQEKQLLSFDDHIGKRQANREKHDL